MNIFLISVILVISISVLFITFQVHADEILPPLKQIKFGMTAQNVVCKSDLILVIRSNDYLPACINPISLNKLQDRGIIHLVLGQNNMNIQNNIINMTSMQIKEKNLSNALSVQVHQKITSLKSFDEITVSPIIHDWKWQFQDNIFTLITDENDKNISKPFLIQQSLYVFDIENQTIKFGSDIPISLISKFNTVVFNYSLPDILPLENGTYNLKFSSLSSAEIKLPTEFIMISNNSKIISLNHKDPQIPQFIDTVFLYDIIFKLK